MKQIVIMGASSSKNSINKRLATHAGTLIEGFDTKIIDLNDFEMPLYSIDIENESGIPQKAVEFSQLIQDAAGVVISFAEHNGAYSAAFKNIFDWASRHNFKTWQDIPVLLMATSPGKRGGSGVLGLATNSFPHFGAKVIAQFSLPSFNENFSDETGVIPEDLKEKLAKAVEPFCQKIG